MMCEVIYMAFKDLSAPKLTFKDIEELAAENKPMLNNMLLEDQNTFLALRNLYSSWRGGHIDREQAQEEKHRIRLAYDKTKQVLGFYSKSYEYNQDNIRRSEAAREKILRDLKAGEDVLIDALMCIGYMRNDAFFISAVQKHFGLEDGNIERNKADGKAG